MTQAMPRPIPGIGGPRSDYDRVKALFASKGVTNAVITPSFLRSEVSGVTTASGFQFNLNTQANAQGSLNATERRLQQNDAFCADRIGFFISTYTTAGGVAGHQVLHTFANPYVFTVAAGLLAAKAFYNSYWSVRNNTVVLVDSVDMLSSQVVDTAQQGLAASANATVNTYGASAWQQDQAFKRMTPNLVYNGTGTNIVNVVLPGTFDFTLTSITVSIVCIQRGWLAQNAGTQRS